MKIKGLVIFLVAACFFSCGENKYAQRLDVVESVINERPDSALAIIKSIDTLSLKSNAIKARYSLLHAMALDKNYIDTTNVNIVMPAVYYYQKYGTAEDQFKAYYYLGRIQYNAGDYNSAAVTFSKAESLENKVQNYQAKGLLYMIFADIYNKHRNIDKEEEYVKKGISAFEAAGDVKQCNLSSGRFAIIKYNRQEWEVADSLFQVGIEQAKNDTVAMSVFLSNYARLKVVQPNPDPNGALELLKKLSSYKRPLSIRDYGVWAYAASLAGDENTCAQIENQLKRLDEPQKATILNWLYRIEQHRGNFAAAHEYFVGAKAYESRFINNLLSDTIGQSLKSYYSSEALNAKQEANLLRLQLSLVILGLCLLFLLSLGYIKHKKDKREKDVERLLKIGEEANKLLTQTNEGLQTTLEDLRKAYVSTYKDKFSAIGELCNAYIASNGRIDKKDYLVRRVEKLIAYISDDDKLHAQFESQINKDLNNIVKHLKADIGGNIDKKESRFICYCIVGFEPEIIGTILNLSVSNVYTKKSRLKERIRGLDSPYKDEYLRML